MIKHIVWWTMKPEADGHTGAENAARIKKMGEELAGKIPGLLSIEMSTDIKGSGTETPTLVLQSSHPTVEALQEYAVHPLHVAVVDVVKVCAASRNSLDYEV
ncbi:Dabb family protein [Desulfovibrio sp. OttesenSCG-928-C06]|nr:Dabb family protein [Desulfovibrio sp. OttesenSCG-928-C06]